MTFKDLKPGMKVWIREDLKTNVKYGDYCFIEGMQELTGLQTIKNLDPCSCFTIKEAVGWLFTPRMIDWDKTEKLNNKNSALFYDGTILKGQIDGQEIKVIRSPEDKEDLEKAIMMGLIKSLGYSYSDVKRLQSRVKEVWRPKFNQKYYYVGACGEVESMCNLDNDFDKKIFEICNYFKTKEEAEQKAVEFRKLFMFKDKMGV